MNLPEYVRRLRKACDWLGIEQGRAQEYVNCLEECDKIKVRDWSLKHRMSYFESYEIVELCKLWNQRIDDFSGLEEKIREACQKGPFLREHEMPGASSNRPRNDAFAYLVAGKFLYAGISIVSVDGIVSKHFECTTEPKDSDVVFMWEGQHIAVECKRPRFLKNVIKQAKKARNQIDSSHLCGIIAIDCSVFCRLLGTDHETSSSEKAEAKISKWLKDYVVPKIGKSGSERILGHMLFARIPGDDCFWSGRQQRPSNPPSRLYLLLAWCWRLSRLPKLGDSRENHMYA